MNNNISFYQQRLNLHNALFTRIEHEDATVATVYKITRPDNSHLILKVCYLAHHYDRELYFLTYFKDKLPVPRIIQTIPPATDINGAILMEYLPGSLLSLQEFNPQLAYDSGQLLAHIHTNPTAGYGDLTKPDSLTSTPHISFCQKFNEGLEECKNNLPPSLLDQCNNYFTTHLDLLAQADGPRIIHRDFRLGNMLVHNGKISGIIDWSSAQASFAQEDFCFLYREKKPINTAARNSFLAGYQNIRPVPDYQAMMPLLLLHRAIATLGFTIKRNTWQTSNASLYQSNRTFLETFF